MIKTDAEKWLEKIDRAKKVKEEWRSLFRIATCYEYWEGRQRPSHIPDAEWITINMVYSCLMAELPSLYSTDPYFYVKLAKSYTVNPMEIAQYELKAKVRQAFLNYLKGELQLKTKARLAIFDAFFQFGVLKVHYYADLIKNPDAGAQITDEETALPLMGDDGPLLEPDFLPANEAYKLSRIHPDDFLVDEDAGPLDESLSWRAQRVKRPLEEVRKDKKYSSTARRMVKGAELSAAEKEREQRKKGGLASESKPDAEPDTVVLWELYDWKRKEWLVVAEGCNEFLLKPSPLPVGIEGDPFIDLRLTLRDDSWYPLPPVSQWVDPQREYCEIRSKVLVHRKRFNRKYEAYAGAYDDPEQAASQLTNGADGTVLLKNQPMQSVYAIQDAPLDQQVHTEIAYIRNDFNDLAVGPNQRGGTAGVDSATEAGILERRTQLREGDKVGLVMDFLGNTGRKIDQCVQAHITSDQAIKVAGPGGIESWRLIRTDDYGEINGEYQYSIAVGSTTPQLPEIERAQWLGFLTWLSQAMTTAPDLVTRGLVRRTAELHHISPDDPLVEEVAKAAEKRVQAIASGQMQLPGGQQGSQPNVTEMNPEAMMGGAAMGINNIRGGKQ